MAERPRLTLERHYPAPPAQVFLAWTDPRLIARWWVPGLEGGAVTAELDLRIGGRYRIHTRMPDGEEHAVGGVYREIEPPHRLVFTWAWQSTPDRESLVTLAFTAEGGGTRLSLQHDGFFDEGARDRHAGGWQRALEAFDALFA